MVPPAPLVHARHPAVQRRRRAADGRGSVAWGARLPRFHRTPRCGRVVAAQGGTADVDGAGVQARLAFLGRERRQADRLTEPLDLARRDGPVQVGQGAGRGQTDAGGTAASGRGRVSGSPQQDLRSVVAARPRGQRAADDAPIGGRGGRQAPVVRSVDQVEGQARVGARQDGLDPRRVSRTPDDGQREVDAVQALGQGAVGVGEAFLRARLGADGRSGRLVDLDPRAAGVGEGGHRGPNRVHRLVGGDRSCDHRLDQAVGARGGRPPGRHGIVGVQWPPADRQRLETVGGLQLQDLVEDRLGCRVRGQWRSRQRSEQGPEHQRARAAVPTINPATTTMATTPTATTRTHTGTFARCATLDSTARCHSEARVWTLVGGSIAPSHRPAASPPRWAALSMRGTAKPKAMLIEDQHPELAHERPALPIDGVVQTTSGQQHAEQPEDGARCPDRRPVPAEHEAADRSGRGAGEIHDDERRRAVPALDDRSGQVQGVHVEEQVHRAGVEQRDRPQPPVLALCERGLVEGEGVEERLALGREAGRQRHDHGRGDEHDRDRQQRPVAAAAGEVLACRARIALLLHQPAQSSRDLGLVLGRGSPVRLPVGGDRAGQVAAADPGGRYVAPGGVGRGRLAELCRGLPGREGGIVVIESMARLAEPEEGGRRDRRVIETHDPRVADRGVAEVARRQSGVGGSEQVDGLGARQAPAA